MRREVREQEWSRELLEEAAAAAGAPMPDLEDQVRSRAETETASGCVNKYNNSGRDSTRDSASYSYSDSDRYIWSCSYTYSETDGC